MNVRLLVLIACCLVPPACAHNEVAASPVEPVIKEPIAAAGLDYICPGRDRRPLGKVGAVLQQAFSWPLRRWTRPPNALKEANQMVAFPPFLAVNVPYGRRWATFRIGWRYDANCEGGRYVGDVIIKLREEQPLFY
jgi:hypothetical protein